MHDKDPVGANVDHANRRCARAQNGAARPNPGTLESVSALETLTARCDRAGLDHKIPSVISTPQASRTRAKVSAPNRMNFLTSPQEISPR
jgi:hypothetical protein